jgi:hypothetical protein
MKIALRKRDEVRKCAVAPDDADDGAAGAVPGTAGEARRTRPAAAVDLANDTAARVDASLRDADELVAEDAGEAAMVPANQLEVGLADAGAEDADEDVAGRRVWIGVRGVE